MVKVVVEAQVPDISKLPLSVRSVCNICLQEKESRATASAVLHALLSLQAY